MTDSTGNIVGEQRYYPFGETRLATGSMNTDKLFTRWIEPVEIGQRNIAGLGIYHYQSRFYSPKLGRFLSADSLVPNPFNPQDYNRYAYVRNNPVRYIDPSGHVCSDPDDPTPTCDNSFLSTTKVGNKVVRGSGLDAGKPKGKPSKPSKPVKRTGNDGGGPLGGASGDVAIPSAPPVAVPVPQPPGSPSVPTITTVTTTTTQTTSVLVIERNPPPSEGFGIDPGLDPFPFAPAGIDPGITYDGKPLTFPFFPDLRVTTITTTSKTVITSIDQYGEIYSMDVFTYTSSVSRVEELYNGVWMPANINNPLSPGYPASNRSGIPP